MSEINETTEVVILTTTYSIQGRIALVPGARLTDYIKQAGDFIAVSDAVVSDLKGNELFQAPFLDVSKLHIEIISPKQLVAKKIDYKNR